MTRPVWVLWEAGLRRLTSYAAALRLRAELASRGYSVVIAGGAV